MFTPMASWDEKSRKFEKIRVNLTYFMVIRQILVDDPGHELHDSLITELYKNNDSRIWVKETPEQIDKLLSYGYYSHVTSH